MPEPISTGIVLLGISVIFAAAGVVYAAFVSYEEIRAWIKGRISKKNSKETIGKTIVKAKKDGKYSVRRIILKNNKKIEESEIIADKVDKKLEEIAKKGDKGKTFKA